MWNLYKLMFFFSMITGTLIAISSYSWLSMWMGLEINLLSILPLMSNSKNSYPAESALKYFITQSLASSILLLSVILSLNFKESLLENFQFSSIILNSALLTKMGAAPFHAWFPEVMEGLNWNLGLLMLTWQKIAPMVLIFYNCSLSMFFLIIILTSTILSGILGLNQISFRKILAYSSINHISWMLASMMHSQIIWMIYFTIYVIITLNITVILKEFQIFYLNQLFNFMNFSKTMKFAFILNFFSLGGVPPLLGFYPKWLVINNLVENNFYLLSTMLIIFTLITLFFYLRLSFLTLMITSKETLIFNPKTLKFKIMWINFISLSGLLVCTLISNFF
uniref:NADH dehydrogenase subunit 2 n=1 Tax=Pseudoechthistatus chiangshunani TaxID=2976366 RepID=UPI0021B57BF1|nr:NADH dehydrogenase subunit 2 [Pseudoechthistatus chiangshunani]UVW93767.1 NADH dehydrogenase subunit 2 [Pseudoechthistatus chiangshunani]